MWQHGLKKCSCSCWRKTFWSKKIRITANKGLRLQLLCVYPFRWKVKAKVDFTSMEERVKKKVCVWVCECVCVSVWVYVCVCVRETINVKSFGDKLRRMGCVWEEAAALRVHLVHGKVYGYCWKRERKWAIS